MRVVEYDIGIERWLGNATESVPYCVKVGDARILPSIRASPFLLHQNMLLANRPEVGVADGTPEEALYVCAQGEQVGRLEQNGIGTVVGHIVVERGIVCG